MFDKMKQITPEIKQRIFALYWGQPIIWMSDKEPRHKHHVCAKTMKSTVFEHMRLGLKPLSSVTDEDLKDLATQVAGISPSEYASANMVAHKRYKQFIVSIKKEELELDVVDFLRSRGYALPAFGYSVDELVEAGVFKLREEQQ